MLKDNLLLVTVTICTRNRARSLEKVLDSLCQASQCVRDDWEVQIIDNGSKDDTKAVVESFAARLPIRHVFEPLAGLSNARNRGVEEARGKFVLWTDDDVCIDAGWLDAYIRAFKANPDVGIFGGKARPIYEEPVAKWFVESESFLSDLLAIRDADWTNVTPTRLPYGLNYAVRRDLQLLHKYDPELGVAPGRRRGGEETEMIRAALQSGEVGLWVWDAIVYHLIPPERQSIEYIMKYYRSSAFDYRYWRDSEKMRINGVPVSVYLYIVYKYCKMKILKLVGNRQDFVKSYIGFAILLGIYDRYASGYIAKTA